MRCERYFPTDWGLEASENPAAGLAQWALCCVVLCCVGAKVQDWHMALTVRVGADSGLCVLLCWGQDTQRQGHICVIGYFVTPCFVRVVQVRHTVQTSTTEQWI